MNTIRSLLSCLTQKWEKFRHQQKDSSFSPYDPGIISCSFCLGNFRRPDIRLTCGGRDRCRGRLCKWCIREWYGLNKPGRTINVAALTCPFCRRRPVTQCMDIPQRLKELAGWEDAVADADTWVYVWCRGCHAARKYMTRSCLHAETTEGGGGGGGGDSVKNMKRWRCTDCDTPKMVDMIKVKKCPGCGILTVKKGGCNNLVCHCGLLWCWVCGLEKPLRPTYDQPGMCCGCRHSH